MERNGIYVDIAYLATLKEEIQQQIDTLKTHIFDLAGEEFNLNSPKQLAAIFEKLEIKTTKKTATGQMKLDVTILESLQKEYPIAGSILEYRSLEKLRSTYIDALPLSINPTTHRVHCTFNQSVTATGRLSCQAPNLQNIPIRTEAGRRIREAFKPQKPGWSFLAADYSQIELRLLAHFSGDANLLHAFNSNEDVHAHTASLIFNTPIESVTKELRRRAKAVNFGIIYGQQAFGLSQELGISMKEAAEFIEVYFERYPGVKSFIEESKKQARLTGKTVTLTGREREIPDIHSKNNNVRSAAERLAVNTPLQGTAADIIKIAMVDIFKALNDQALKTMMILQVHDELIFEAPNEELATLTPLVRSHMEGAIKLKVPLIVEIAIGTNWKEC